MVKKKYKTPKCPYCGELFTIEKSGNYYYVKKAKDLLKDHIALYHRKSLQSFMCGGGS